VHYCVCNIFEMKGNDVHKEDKRDFDIVADTWDEEPRRVKLAEEVTAAIRREVSLTRDMEALDYGCGSGLVTLGVRPFVGHITGADSSSGMLDVLEKKVREQGLHNVTPWLIDLEDLEQVTGSYDLIISSMTLHHVHDVKALLSKFVHLLNPMGFLALADLESEDGSFHDNPTGVHHHGFDKDFLRDEFKANGLLDVNIVTVSTVNKLSQGGIRHSYPVILAVGRRPA
jgi:ubiquinone/menaquinone biosynthesis C-methylase UbiE